VNTKIRTPFGEWSVPRGFGREYRRVARDHAHVLAKGSPGEVIRRIQDILSLIGYAPTVAAVADWDARKRVEAFVYASNVHARASDNFIPRHPPLSWLPEPWDGGYDNFGALPTPIGGSA